MKLLVDMNLSPLWVETLLAAGFTVTHWMSIGDPRAPDTVILDWARANQVVVFTHDLEFGRLLALTGEHGPSVVQLRTHGVPAPHSIAALASPPEGGRPSWGVPAASLTNAWPSRRTLAPRRAPRSAVARRARWRRKASR